MLHGTDSHRLHQLNTKLLNTNNYKILSSEKEKRNYKKKKKLVNGFICLVHCNVLVSEVSCLSFSILHLTIEITVSVLGKSDVRHYSKKNIFHYQQLNINHTYS